MELNDLFAALGLAMALEGIAYALFPDAMRRMLGQVLALTPSHLRLAGVVAAAAGVGIVWLVRG